VYFVYHYDTSLGGDEIKLEVTGSNWKYKLILAWFLHIF